MSPADAELLRCASALHDVGKVGIPDEILTKPGPLDAGEWETMKTHTTIGADILSGSSSALVQLSQTIALTHHEHWDGPATRPASAASGSRWPAASAPSAMSSTRCCRPGRWDPIRPRGSSRRSFRSPGSSTGSGSRRLSPPRGTLSVS